jgi:cellulose synthase/poly-beta-1,6-N-acetylglucosamine synthase-like glycosyltransferase
VWRDVAVALGASWAGSALLAALALALLADFALAAAAHLENARQRRRQRLADRMSLFESDLAPPVSVLVYARDAADVIVDRVRALLPLAYPGFEIVVVNDGSSDDTLERLTRAFALRETRRTRRGRVSRARLRGAWASPEHAALLVLDVTRGGRARALNAALAFSRHPLALVMDASVTLERDTLIKLVLPFYEDPSVLAVGGVARPADLGAVRRDGTPAARLPARRLQRIEALEALREALVGGLGWQLVDSLFVLPGPVALFEREALRAVGGFRPGADGDDADLVMRLQSWAGRRRRRLAVRMVGGALAWVQAAPGLGAMARVRMRAQRGRIESLWDHRELVMNTRFAFHHGVAFVSQLFASAVRPAVELASLTLAVWLVAAGRFGTPYLWLFLALYVAGGTLVSLAALALELSACRSYRWPRDFETLALDALLEPLTVRPILSAARVTGVAQALLVAAGAQWAQLRKRESVPEAPADTTRAA